MLGATCEMVLLGGITHNYAWMFAVDNIGVGIVGVLFEDFVLMHLEYLLEISQIGLG